MENIKNKLIELGNYLIKNYDKSNEKYYYNIKGTLIDLPEFLIPQVLNLLREENDNENQTVIENEIEVVKKSQLFEWSYIYGIDLSNLEVKNKLNEYLNELLEFKKSL